MDLKGAEIRNLVDLCVDIGSKNSVPVRINIPFYQRPYKWDTEHIDNLINDFMKNMQENQQSEYFVGSVVLVKNAHGTNRNDVIDGQQRITTVFLMNYLRMILLRAYIEESLYTRRTNLDSYLRQFEDCYSNLFGTLDTDKYQKLRTFIVEQLDVINDVSDEEKECIYTKVLQEFQKQTNLPVKDFTDIENYRKEYEEKQKVSLDNDELALKYSRESYNDKLKEALSKIIVVVSKDKNPEILVNDVIEDKIINQYISAIREEFDEVKKYAEEKSRNPMDCAKNMIEKLMEMIDNIKFCVILTGNERDAYTLFEVLNDRAMDIEDIDLIKNLYYKEYCNKSDETDSKIIDKNIEKLDSVWSEEVFTRDLGATCVKLISYLGAIYLTANEDIYLNKIEKYRQTLEEEYFDKHYSVGNKPYDYYDVLKDINVYKMLKIIIQGDYKLPFQNASKYAIDAECDIKKSITYKTLHLLNALNLTGVMPALTNLIIKKYMVEKVEDKKIIDTDDFRQYVKDIMEDSEHSNPLYTEIHKWSYEIWKCVLYSKDYNLPRELSKRIIANVNYDTYNLHLINIDTDFAEKMQNEFKQWIDEWQYGKKMSDLKAKILFINLFKYTKDTSKLKLNSAIYTFSTDKLHLDHLEAQKPSDVAEEKYFTPADANEKREKYVNSLGNFMILDSDDNNFKNNKPLYDALSYYQNMCPNHWMILEIENMLNEEKYHNSINIKGQSYHVPNETFFNERRARLKRYFQAILNRKLDEKEISIE